MMNILLAIDFENLHTLLRSLYDEMMPLCANMAGVARAIAGLGALFYIAYRVWQSLARAEAIDVFPLLRPFAIGLCILMFPTVVLGTLNAVMTPIVQGVATMLEGEKLDMQQYREQKDKLEYEAMKRNPETAYLVSNEEFDKQLEELGWSPGDVWDGFQSTLTQWLCRYIQVYLWLPVSDLFSCILAKIQVLMLQNDIERMQADPNFSLDSSDGVYIIFMIIGIIGYFTVPTVASWVIQAGGMGNYNRNVNSVTNRSGALAGGAVGATAGNVAGRLRKIF